MVLSEIPQTSSISASIKSPNLQRPIQRFPLNHKKKHSNCIHKFRLVINIKRFHISWTDIHRENHPFFRGPWIDTFQTLIKSCILNNTVVLVLQRLKCRLHHLYITLWQPLKIIQNFANRHIHNCVIVSF